MSMFVTQESGLRAERMQLNQRRKTELKAAVHNRLVDMLNLEKSSLSPTDQLRAEVRRLVNQISAEMGVLLSDFERDQFVDDVLDETFGLGPLEVLLKDPTVSDILVNGPEHVYVERQGVIEKSDIRFRDAAHLMHIIDRIVTRVGRRVDESSPMVDARLLDGSRVNVIIPPLSLDGPMLCIRRFGRCPLTIANLVEMGTLTEEMVQFLQASVRSRLNIMISGGTGTGKTTLLNVLSGFVPDSDRIITIEDSAELILQQRHVVRLETRPPNVEGKGEITQRDLVRNSLRMRPDRIIVGEVRGREALDMLQAMNTGHEGSLTTVHANSPRDAISRIEIMVAMAGLDLPVRAVRQQFASAIDLIIQIGRLPGGRRRLLSISEVTGMEGDIVALQDLFVFRQEGVSTDGHAYGAFTSEGLRPRCYDRLNRTGHTLPTSLFQKRVLRRVEP